MLFVLQRRVSTIEQGVPIGDNRLRLIAVCFGIIGIIICTRLLFLMVVQHQFYEAIAAGSQEIYRQLFPERGNVFLQDTRTNDTFPLAMNKDVFLLYVDTRQIPDEQTIVRILDELTKVFAYTEEKKLAVLAQLQKKDDPYEPIEQQVDDSIKETLETLKLPGIGFVRHARRFYPEATLAAQVIGFVGKDDQGKDIGRYGIEGYWNKELAGEGGFLAGAKSAGGGLIPLADQSLRQAVDGADIVLTIDRTLQFIACEELKKRTQEYGATSASLIIMEPYTGAILAMCSMPDFDPNTYNQVDNVMAFNNTSVFTAYEPGSIFKPLTVAAAMNEDLITPDTYFYDPGSTTDVCDKPIKNALNKVYKDQTMTGVLENSINTGMVDIVKRLGKKTFVSYVEKFGFGVKSGLPIDTEGTGTIDALFKNKKDIVDCYSATASFGQGITVTPLQMAAAFSAIANGGVLMKPYIVQEVRHSNGNTDVTVPTEIRRVITPRTASLVAGMMVSVIDNGQAKAAAVPGYYIAGKTGTAQIAERGGYAEATNHSFVGFGPIDRPAFVMVIKYEKPQRNFSDSTTAPTFASIAKEILEYYRIPPKR